MVYKQRKFFFHSFGGLIKSKIKKLADSVSNEGWLPDHRCCLLSVSSHGGRGRGTLWYLFYKRTLILFIRAPSYDLIASQRQHLQITSHWRLDFNIRILWGGHIQSIHMPFSFNVVFLWAEFLIFLNFFSSTFLCPI